MGKTRLALTVLATAAFAALGVSPALTQSASNRVQFFCGQGYDPEINQYVPTTFAQVPQQRKTAIIRWKSDQFSGWPPKERCEAVSPRFQRAYENGILNYLTHGWMNRQRVVCATGSYGGPCEELLLTLKPGDNPFQVLNQLNAILGGNASSVLNQNTGESQIYIRFDVEAFLEQAPVQE